jgi:hypothetical protein
MSTLPPKSETALVLNPPMVEPLDNIHSSAIPSQTNELDNFVSSYQTITYNTPPTPPMGTEIPHGMMPNSYFNKFNAPNRVPRFEPRRNLINSYEDYLDTIREDLKKPRRNPIKPSCSSSSPPHRTLIHPYATAPLCLSSTSSTITLVMPLIHPLHNHPTLPIPDHPG